MPTKRTRISRRAAPKVSPAFLAMASDRLFKLPDDEQAKDDYLNWRFFMTDEEKTEIWQECREVILEAWVEANPGSRPFMWWAVDAPEPRRRLSGSYESQAIYLRRLGLLTPQEMEQLTSEDYGPDER